MFVKAIGTASGFTRPIHTIARLWGETTVVPGAATLFFVNADGWALTCKHVASEFVAAEQLSAKRVRFNAERAELATGGASRQALKTLERTHGFTRGVAVEIHHRFIRCVEGSFQLEIRLHPTLDVALLHFKECSALRPTTFAVFAARGDELKQRRIGCGRHAVAADDFEFLGDHATDGERRSGVVPEHQADLHVAATRF